VQAFWRALDVRSSDATERDRLAAKLVGRWRSGAPLVLSPERDRPELADVDDFDFEGTDPRGARCPFGAHIRRANPRDWWLAGWAPFAARMSNQHRLLRRSRPYGAPLAESMEPSEMLRAADDRGERGLLFMAFNADIRRQFELIQEAWFNGPHFGRLRGEVDPLVGRAELAGPFTIQGNPISKRVHGLPSCVRVKGSGYFFFPSIAAARFLAQWAVSSKG
jgi:deferrochelatase/peroxidase EfeB